MILDKSSPVTSVRREFPGNPLETCVRAQIDEQLFPNTARLDFEYEVGSAKIWCGEKDDSGVVAAYLRFKDDKYVC